MTKQIKLKCLRCGCQYLSPPSQNPEMEERTCPKCRSNSVRIITEDKAQ